MLPVTRLVSAVRFFDEPMLQLARWISERYVAPLATVLGVLSPPRVAGEEADLTQTVDDRAQRPEVPKGPGAPPAPATLSGYRGGHGSVHPAAGARG